MAKITLYHGTAHAFPAFDSQFVRRGTEPNSALGIHLTENPALAAEYAQRATHDSHGGKPRVLIVEAEVSKAALVRSAADFLGRDPEIFDVETNRSHSEFVARRFELLDEGFDAITTEETELEDCCGCWIVLEHSNVTIVGEMAIEEAQEFELDDVHFPGVVFDEVTLFESELAERMEP
jgi:hypothetical protein